MKASRIRLIVLSGIAAISLVVLGSVTMFRGEPLPPIPTLDLEVAYNGGSLLGASLVGAKDGVNIYIFNEADLPAAYPPVSYQDPENDDPHVYFKVSSPISAKVFFNDDINGKDYLAWLYEYTGNESNLLAEGKSGREVFAGAFYLTKKQKSGYDHLHVEDLILTPGKQYYLMVSRESLVDAEVDFFPMGQENDDGDLSSNAWEDRNLNGVVDSGETSPTDADTDDDGISDSDEIIHYNGLDPADADTDDDGLQDGTEVGIVMPNTYTDVSVFIPDADPTTTTDPLNADTDSGGAADGLEDVNKNGRVDEGERDPNNANDDIVCGNGEVEDGEECDDKNNASGDGCYECEIEGDMWHCSGEPSVCEFVIPGLDDEDVILHVSEKSLGTEDVAVENQKDVTFMRFEALAQGEDIFMNQIIVKADEGSLVDATDYTLWVDSDNNGEVDTLLQSGLGCTGCSADEGGGIVAFSNIQGGGFTIPVGSSKIFEVHADISSSLMHEQLSVGLAEEDENVIVAETREDGDPLLADQIFVTAATSKVFNLKPQGSLFVTQDAAPIRSHHLLAGALSGNAPLPSDPLLHLQFRAEAESINVTRLVFTDAEGSQSIDRLQLYKEGMNEAFANATVSNCIGINGTPEHSLCALMITDPLLVPKDESVGVLVRAQMKPEGGGAIHDTVQLKLSAPEGNWSSVEAYGLKSNNALATNNADGTLRGEIIIGTGPATADQSIIGNEYEVVFAKIVDIENVNPDDDYSEVPRGSNKSIARFKFTAAAHSNGGKKVTIDDIIFTIDHSSNVELFYNGFYLLNLNDPIQKILCSALDSEGNVLEVLEPDGDVVSSEPVAYVQCSGSENGVVDLSMGSNESATLVLEASIQSYNDDEEAHLQVSLANFSSNEYPISGGIDQRTHLQWSDSISEPQERIFGWIDIGEEEVKSTYYSNGE